MEQGLRRSAESILRTWEPTPAARASAAAALAKVDSQRRPK
jgi:hypothetical protein